MPSNENRDIVMLVDDNPDELGLLVEAMQEAGFAALAFASGEAALTALERALPNLVVLDAVMPGLDGFETCQRIKADARFAHLPVIFMTGLKEPDDILKGLEAGSVDYVTKPVNFQELVARVRVHIANGRVAFGARVALDATGRFLLATDGTGKARWSTPQAGGLLAERIGTSEPAFATALFRRLILAQDTGKAQPMSEPADSGICVTYLGKSGPDEHLFRLTTASGDSETDLLRGQFGLTDREAEVLIWIARGKSNKEVSDILLISPRTVNKHLERIFTKLGVENRASAASVVMRVLATRE
jgi:DNA-binding NarL/FixJ family response regulator